MTAEKCDTEIKKIKKSGSTMLTTVVSTQTHSSLVITNRSKPFVMAKDHLIRILSLQRVEQSLVLLYVN